MGLIALVFEEHRISTVCVVMNRDITQNVKLPRALFVRFPDRVPFGPANDAVTQMGVIREALGLLNGATQPATIAVSDIEWPE